jgi:hypothetical protein
MLVRDTIRRLRQVERSKKPGNGPLLRKNLIWSLVVESNEVIKEVILFDFSRIHLKKSLLHVLHARRLNRDDARCLERFRYSNDPNGSFLTRFEDVNSLCVLPITMGREEVVRRWEYFLQTAGPLHLVILLISLKAISSSTRTMTRYDIATIDVTINSGK